MVSISLSEIVKNQRTFFKSGKTRNLDFRILQLKKLKMAIQKNEELIFNALKKDLNKPEIESYITELGLSLIEIDNMIKNLKKYAKPKKVKTPLAYIKSKSYIISEPLGVTLIISPWNYPFQLTINPLIGSIAAGNCCIIKTSSMSPNTSSVIRTFINNTFNENYITVVENKKDTSSMILKEKFDYIFFTGSPRIGRIVMESAAKNLTPVTLELGGKSPCIVDTDINIKNTCRRICFGKFSNSGQTCVAPDYLLVNKNIKNDLIDELKTTITNFYGSNPQNSKYFGRIINSKHFNRLKNLLQGQNIIFGGKMDENERYISPTILDNVSLSSPIMQEEIFGPILPVIEYSSLQKAIDIINTKSKPLALYIFSKDKNVQNVILQRTSSGGVCINDTLIHITTDTLPFGGVGESGMGNYHGKASFDTFSHKKSILKSPFSIDTKVYPPYKITLEKAKKLLKFL
ncbi:aldehyde dehydrogenase [Haloimpatiens sp. FM7330]|uniref:aldehyde dehydrogenase n=1 Tax=Haloimpatiens sp. FM7330 TaxID=3298610 RepID=UPI00363D63CA